MSLSIGLDVALSGLSVTAEQTAVVSRNVARASDPHASRKSANLVTLPGGGVQLASITRATNTALLDKMLGPRPTCGGAASRSSTRSNQLDQTVNDPELDSSPAALIAKLADAIQQYCGVAAGLGCRAHPPWPPRRPRSGPATMRPTSCSRCAAQADCRDRRRRSITSTRCSPIRSRQQARSSSGTRLGDDVTDYLDQRDQVLASLAEEIGIRTVARSNNDMAIYTDSGVTLFDVRARTVTFDRTLLYSPGTAGNAVYVDGVPVTDPQNPMATRIGRLAGLATVRDKLAVTYQSQLDEIARGLIGTFAESDQSATPTLPDVPGLFTYPGAPAMPPAGSILTGLAGSIMLNPNADPAQGGDPEPAARRRHVRQSGLPLQRVRRSCFLGPYPAARRPSQRAAVVRSRLPGRAFCFRCRFCGLVGRLAAAGASGHEQRCRLQERPSAAQLRSPVQRHRRQSRRGNDAAPGAGAVLPGLDAADHDDRQHAGRLAAGGGLDP